MIDWRDAPPLTFADPIFGLCEVAALLSLLGQRGVSASTLLNACGLSLTMLEDVAARISLQQHCRLAEAAVHLSGDSTLLSALTRRLHLTTFGIVGFGLLSSQTLDHLIRFAENYSPLLNLKFSLRLRVDGAAVRLCFEDRYGLDPRQHSLCAATELGKIGMLLNDVLGPDFRLRGACCVGADEGQARELTTLLHCPIETNGQRTELLFDGAWLARPLPQADVATHSNCREVCDRLMADLSSRFDLEQHVRQMLMQASGQLPSLPELAQRLHVSPRTVRTRLDALNTSYAEILNDVRKELAIRYLTATTLSTQEIAQFLGYAEATNFRHAFKRWTGKLPREYRMGVRKIPSSTAPRSLPVRNVERLACGPLSDAMGHWRPSLDETLSA